MALKISLKSGERMILGGAVVTNGSSGSCDLIVENKVPILRQKDILTEAKADSPCRRIYLTVQLMYIDEANLSAYHKAFWEMAADVVKAAPSMVGLIDGISEMILQRNYYQALKLTKRLIDYEQEVIRRVSDSVENV
jgi:flagellar biosynthesis repressor protein FlbT